MHTRAAPLNKSNPIEGGPQQFSRIYRTIYQSGVSRIFTTCGAMSSIVTSRMRNRVFLSFPAHAPPHSPGANTALGGTDARKYDIVSKNIYRFTPVQVTKNERDAMHNVNERISIENLGRAITFYTTFIQNYQ